MDEEKLALRLLEKYKLNEVIDGFTIDDNLRIVKIKGRVETFLFENETKYLPTILIDGRFVIRFFYDTELESIEKQREMLKNNRIWLISKLETLSEIEGEVYDEINYSVILKTERELNKQ